MDAEETLANNPWKRCCTSGLYAISGEKARYKCMKMRTGKLCHISNLRMKSDWGKSNRCWLNQHNPTMCCKEIYQLSFFHSALSGRLNPLHCRKERLLVSKNKTLIPLAETMSLPRPGISEGQRVLGLGRGVWKMPTTATIGGILETQCRNSSSPAQETHNPCQCQIQNCGMKTTARLHFASFDCRRLVLLPCWRIGCACPISDEWDKNKQTLHQCSSTLWSGLQWGFEALAVGLWQLMETKIGWRALD